MNKRIKKKYSYDRISRYQENSGIVLQKCFDTVVRYAYATEAGRITPDMFKTIPMRRVSSGLRHKYHLRKQLRVSHKFFNFDKFMAYQKEKAIRQYY